MNSKSASAALLSLNADVLSLCLSFLTGHESDCFGTASRACRDLANSARSELRVSDRKLRVIARLNLPKLLHRALRRFPHLVTIDLSLPSVPGVLVSPPAASSGGVDHKADGKQSAAVELDLTSRPSARDVVPSGRDAVAEILLRYQLSRVTTLDLSRQQVRIRSCRAAFQQHVRAVVDSCAVQCAPAMQQLAECRLVRHNCRRQRAQRASWSGSRFADKRHVQLHSDQQQRRVRAVGSLQSPQRARHRRLRDTYERTRQRPGSARRSVSVSRASDFGADSRADRDCKS